MPKTTKRSKSKTMSSKDMKKVKGKGLDQSLMSGLRTKAKALV